MYQSNREFNQQYAVGAIIEELVALWYVRLGYTAILSSSIGKPGGRSPRMITPSLFPNKWYNIPDILLYSGKFDRSSDILWVEVKRKSEGFTYNHSKRKRVEVGMNLSAFRNYENIVNHEPYIRLEVAFFIDPATTKNGYTTTIEEAGLYYATLSILQSDYAIDDKSDLVFFPKKNLTKIAGHKDLLTIKSGGDDRLESKDEW